MTVPTAVPMARFIIEAAIDRLGSMPAMALNDLIGRVNIKAMTVAMIASIIRHPTPTGAVDRALSTSVIRPAATVNLTTFKIAAVNRSQNRCRAENFNTPTTEATMP
jgi:hypothetical protein